MFVAQDNMFCSVCVRTMSQTVDEDVIFDDVYQLCEVIGRSVDTHIHNALSVIQV